MSAAVSRPLDLRQLGIIQTQQLTGEAALSTIINRIKRLFTRDSVDNVTSQFDKQVTRLRTIMEQEAKTIAEHEAEIAKRVQLKAAALAHGDRAKAVAEKIEALIK